MTLMWLAKTVYPDLFEDVDMTEEVENYYKEVYNIELTDDQVAQMYTPSADAANGYGSSSSNKIREVGSSDIGKPT